MKYLFIVLIVFNSLYSDNINNIFQNEEQKKNFKIINDSLDVKVNKYYQLDPIELVEEQYEEECIEIEKINFIGSTIISKSTLDNLSKNYLNKCNGIKRLNNLAKKITNIYIKKGYVTSKAYIKLQDLSDGEIEISIMEGKINKIIYNGIYIGNTFSDFENKLLNLRDLEVSIQQQEKLKSQFLTLQLIPADKLGYTNVLIVNKKVRNPLQFKFNINNYSDKLIGKYNVSIGLSYDNPFNINDILTFGYSTTNKNELSNGYTLSYAFPFYRSNFTLSHSKFKYNQYIINRLAQTIKHSGISTNNKMSFSYRIFHDKKNALNLNLSYLSKLSSVTINDTLTTLNSTDANTITIGLNHKYNTISSSYYFNFNINKYVNNYNEEDNQINYGLDLSYSTNLRDKSTLNYTSLLHILYSKEQKLGKGQQSVGGPYSVRGFKDNTISGYVGGFIRNDLSIVKNISKLIYKPKISLDFGYIQDDDTASSGLIIGSSLGIEFKYKSSLFTINYSIPLKHTEETKLKKSSFLGLSYEYKY